MIFPKQETIEKLRDEYPEGTRIRIIRMHDANAPSPGTCGTVTHIDDMGTVFARWDNGSSLGIVYLVDKCEKIGGTEE